ncbi:hypothetical protein BJ138DRAFT_1095850 [Hygrophoropsis aurantiaca]|uniref:Uncharacterized protein n=1 Tax=Hygrophoropsis aurantiaca TaxID=72124 RepID=A0ACB7ZU57_9AGAM|nr:hypothetical protein BJ138DRAFT_1095850 [Hygrophoropsis aurantiaca]
MSDSGEGFEIPLPPRRTRCTALVNGKQCECDMYFPPPDGSAPPILCQECMHGRSKHPAELLKGSGGPPSEARSAGTAAANVQSIFNGVIASSRKKAIKIADLPSNQSLKVTKDVARDEILAEFRPAVGSSRIGGSTSRKSSRIDPKLAKSTRQIEKGQQVTVPIWVALVNYLDHGCAHLDKKDIGFNPGWSHDEVEQYLRKLFPQPFECIDNLLLPHIDERPAKGKMAVRAAPWALISKEHGKLSVVPENFPTGSDLNSFKGRKQTGFGGSTVIIGERQINVVISMALTRHSDYQPSEMIFHTPSISRGTQIP